MPLYDIICEKCGETKEVFLKLDETEPVCSACGERMIKAMSAPAFILKGSGWYKDLYGLKKPEKSKSKENKNA